MFNMKYYNENSDTYIESTINIDMSEEYELVSKYLHNGDSILDVGFGSGRDMIHFSNLGYDVEGIDPEIKFVEHAKELNLNASLNDAINFKSGKRYNLIWCCASLLHLKRDDIKAALDNLYNYLKTNGIIFLSMKYSAMNDGLDEKGRYFTYLKDTDIKSFPFGISEFRIKKDTTQKGYDWIDIIITKSKSYQ